MMAVKGTRPCRCPREQQQTQRTGRERQPGKKENDEIGEDLGGGIFTLGNRQAHHERQSLFLALVNRRNKRQLRTDPDDDHA
jgi:hypothetical protein